MNHPLFARKRNTYLYIGIWLTVLLGHFLILLHGIGLPFQLSFADSAVTNTLFALLGLALWYPVYYNRTAAISASTQVVNLITAGIISILIWISISTVILDSLYIQQVGYGFLSMHHWRIASSILFYVIILMSYHILIFQQHIKEKQQREEELSALLKDAELNALKSQINPHFLFNSLNSISSLTMYEPAKAQEMIIKLSDYLRYTVTASKNATATYAQEINNIEKYLDIEKIRFGERIKFTLSGGDCCGNCLLPSLLLQPIFENAIKHGVNESTDPIKIRAFAKRAGNYLELEISNNYPQELRRNSGTGTGLKNVHSRLAVMYGSSQLVQVHKENGLFTICLKIPQPQTALEN